MKTGIVKFSKEFVTPIGLKEWVGVEMEYDMSGECPKEVLTNAKAIVEQWHEANGNGIVYENKYNLPQQEPTWIRPTVIQSKPEDKETGVTPDLILASKDLAELESFRWHLKKNNELERAYMLRHDQLMAEKIINDTVKYGNA